MSIFAWLVHTNWVTGSQANKNHRDQHDFLITSTLKLMQLHRNMSWHWMHALIILATKNKKHLQWSAPASNKTTSAKPVWYDFRTSHFAVTQPHFRKEHTRRVVAYPWSPTLGINIHRIWSGLGRTKLVLPLRWRMCHARNDVDT